MPSGWKLEGGEGKAVFKRALRGLVPDATLERPKQGFAVPLSQWMRGELAAELDSVVEDAGLDDVLDRDALRSMVGKHRSRVRDFGWPLYSVLAFGAWHRRWIRGDRSGAVEAPPPPPPGIGSRRS